MVRFFSWIDDSSVEVGEEVKGELVGMCSASARPPPRVEPRALSSASNSLT